MSRGEWAIGPFHGLFGEKLHSLKSFHGNKFHSQRVNWPEIYPGFMAKCSGFDKLTCYGQDRTDNQISGAQWAVIIIIAWYTHLKFLSIALKCRWNQITMDRFSREIIQKSHSTFSRDKQVNSRFIYFIHCNFFYACVCTHIRRSVRI